MPGGRVAWIFDRFASPSLRVTWSVNGLNEPAVGSVVPALRPGEKPPPEHPSSMPKELVRFTVFPDHETSSALTVFSPQVGGLTSAAEDPPKSFR